MQILQPSSQVQGPGGYHNVSLKIGPPIAYGDAGRYVCLINNPQGHKHKEIFLKIADYSRNKLFDTNYPAKAAAGELKLDFVQCVHFECRITIASSLCLKLASLRAWRARTLSVLSDYIASH